LGIKGKIILTGNGSPFRSKTFALLVRKLALKVPFAQPCRSQTNGKAEHSIQSDIRDEPISFSVENSAVRIIQHLRSKNLFDDADVLQPIKCLLYRI
jgi:transposase InsO family protein